MAQQVTVLEQQVIELLGQLDGRDQELPAAMSKCHRLHGGPIAAEPFRRYRAQAEDLVRWLGDGSFPMFSALEKAEPSRA
jgi:hypothetical protein